MQGCHRRAVQVIKNGKKAGQAPGKPRHICRLLPLLRSRPGGVCSCEIARRPEP